MFRSTLPIISPTCVVIVSVHYALAVMRTTFERTPIMCAMSHWIQQSTMSFKFIPTISPAQLCKLCISSTFSVLLVVLLLVRPKLVELLLRQRLGDLRLLGHHHLSGRWRLLRGRNLNHVWRRAWNRNHHHSVRHEAVVHLLLLLRCQLLVLLAIVSAVRA